MWPPRHSRSQDAHRRPSDRSEFPRVARFRDGPALRGRGRLRGAWPSHERASPGRDRGPRSPAKAPCATSRLAKKARGLYHNSRRVAAVPRTGTVRPRPPRMATRREEKAPREPKALPVLTSKGSDEGLVRYDPLRAYMAEVSRHPLLSRDEEHALAMRYHETGDFDAAYKLVASNLRLVVKIAHEYRRSAFSLLDLVQEGNIGLMQAVKKYDPFKGVKLSSYAAWWIRAYIIRFIMDNWRLVKLGTTQAQRKLFFNLAKEREKLLAHGIEPTPRLLARNLQVEEKDVEEMSARMASEDLSLDAPVGSEDESARQTRL